MLTQHLTDEEIQEYAFHKTGCATRLIHHVHHCETCQEKVAAYEVVFTGIGEQPAPVFDFDLEKAVLAQLPAYKHRSLANNWLTWLLVVAGMLLVTTAIYYCWDYVSSFVAGIAPLLIYVMLTSVVVFLAFLCFDMYNTYKQKLKALDFY